MAEEKDLIKKRGSFKGRLTVFANYVSGLEASSMTSSEISELQLRVGKLEVIFEQFDEVQLRLECLSDCVDEQISERTDFENTYFKVISKANSIISTYNQHHQSEIKSDHSDSGSAIHTSKPVKLPTIELPKFSGSHVNWLEFRDTFSSLIHNNSSIDSINKFHYLRSSLLGSAAVVINSISFSANNYSIAWKVLCERYDNVRLLIQNHVNALFNIDPIVKESAQSLKYMIDQLNKNLRALESLGEPTQHWDTLLIHILTSKFNSSLNRGWEEYKGRLSKDSPITLDSFIDYMSQHADLLESMELSRNTVNTQVTQSKQNKHKTMVNFQDTESSCHHTSSSKSCPKCNGEHQLNNCSQFLALTNEARLQLLPGFKVCFNCFRKGHYANNCKRAGCKVCKRRHNTLVHITHSVSPTSQLGTHVLNNIGTDTRHESTGSLPPKPDSQIALAASVLSPNLLHTGEHHEVLLSTALIKVFDKYNREHVVRAVLDSGSTSSIMTERMNLLLDLPIRCIDRAILGINNVSSHVGKSCRVHIKSLNNNYSTDINCFILPSITSNVPSNYIDISKLNIPSNICLADPNFYTPSSVDFIIGSDVFWDLLGSQSIKLGDGKPVLHETRLGWLVSGPMNSGYVSNFSFPIICNFVKNKPESLNNDIQNQLTRFWQLEEVSPLCQYSNEERLCEEHFVKNTTRLNDGRFCVKIPLNKSPNVLGNSYKRAYNCLLSLERRLLHQPTLHKMYIDFMTEYEVLGHMSELTRNKDSEVNAYFIPHHGVLREQSSTTKLRVVFNASSPTTSGLSLNNIQMIGPTVQDDLLSILIRFRQHKYILAADVEKMYRQITVHSDNRALQQILWRKSPRDPVKVYQLNTVTYGTSSAPFLATRCLKEIGLTCKDKMISDIIIHDFYVDDLLTGGDDFHEVMYIRQQVTSELASACMPLRKWKSNNPHLVSDFNQSPHDLNVGSTISSKTLGLDWLPESDEVCFPIGVTVSGGDTKRDMLSVISQIFDPLGLLAPCVILMKILLQSLWLKKLSWDEQLPEVILKVWTNIVLDLPMLNNIRIPRRIACDLYKSIEFHIFTDASERAYGACLYVRSVDETGKVVTCLLLAKSRVAPLKPATIPRLELCGALTGARIYEKAINSIRTPVKSVTFWTDSTIVLGWLKMSPNKLETFVRNRIVTILDITGDHVWRHVPTADNPADHVSRGVDVRLIQSLDQWWSGPSFLKLDKSCWPCNFNTTDILPEVKPEISLHVTNDVNSNFIINFERFSNFMRLKRCVAYILRFIKLCKKEQLSKHITYDDLEEALDLMIRISQKQSFIEYQLLLDKQNLPYKSPLIKFNVFLDDKKIMRIGGRLSNSSFSYDKKYPILIQSTHLFTKLLFNYEHRRLSHAGPQLLLASIRDKYWPIGGRNLAKLCFRQCVRCTRMKGRVTTPIMGNLPQNRIQPGGHPFESVGVDYAGPLLSASRQGRGCRLEKVYIAVFICFTTKAIHLELVGDLSSNNFLMALRRFVSRRGKPKDMYSDNGTTFVGAFNEISKFLRDNCDSLSTSAAGEEIRFHFIPPYSPHFGGIWEAGVKSVKFHLQRVLGNCRLTYEELNTTLIQIEALLNSRPLTPLSSDPEDLLPLTPGHFLIGRPLNSMPEQNYEDHSVNYLTRFQRIQQLMQHFWSRWSKEYISELQQRVKWRSCKDSLKLGALVVIKEDNLPPMKWRLGRVTALYPGKDGICRVADIRTAGGITRRSFSKICILPI